MADQYDVVIIGAGPGGYNCAIRCGQLGLKTAIIEKRSTLGGTCLNVGCIPSKALLHASEQYEAAAKHFGDMGIVVSGLGLDLPKMLGQKDEAVDGLTKGVAFLMKKNKVTTIFGAGTISGPGKVSVTADDGTVTGLSATNIVIATGSEVTPLPGVEIDETTIVSSTGALNLPEVPGRMIVIGAGIIGLELGSVWRRLGAQVTVIEYLDRITPGMDLEAAKQLQRILTKQGMVFQLGRKVTGAVKGEAGVTLSVEPAAGGPAEQVTADVVLVAIGRRPFTTGLGLETVGIELDRRGFVPNDHGRTSAPGVWVVGDATTGAMLAHKAEEEGAAVAELIAGLPGHVNHAVIPGVVYTFPEAAWVGRNEEELKAEGIAYKVGKFPFSANSRARCNHETDGLVKVIEDAATKRILGVHMVGAGVGELIAEAALAMEFGASAEDIARTCHAHPTTSEATRQAAMAVDGWAMQI
jgi:dihydrolipoamide dehydrogenase